MAKFVKLKYPKLVIEQLATHDGDIAQALRESFHKVDELLEDMVRDLLVVASNYTICILATMNSILYCITLRFPQQNSSICSFS